MGRYDGILIASDFDRTLTDPQGLVPQANLDALRSFMDEGGRFAVASGRSVPMFREKRRLFIDNAPTILCNGAVCYDFNTERTVFDAPLPDVEPLVTEMMAKYPLHNVEVQGNAGHFAWRMDAERKNMFDELGVPLLGGTYRERTEPIYMLFFGGEFIRPDDATRDFQSGSPEIDAMFEAINRIVEADGTLSATRSTRLNDEIMVRGVSKGSAARRLANLYGCRTLVCVGDAMNDLAMLREADLAFTPADGDESIRPLVGTKLTVAAPCTAGTIADVIAKL